MHQVDEKEAPVREHGIGASASERTKTGRPPVRSHLRRESLQYLAPIGPSERRLQTKCIQPECRYLNRGHHRGQDLSASRLVVVGHGRKAIHVVELRAEGAPGDAVGIGKEPPSLGYPGVRVRRAVHLDIAQVLERLHVRPYVSRLHRERDMAVHGKATRLRLLYEHREDVRRDHLVDLHKVDSGLSEPSHIRTCSLGVWIPDSEQRPVLSIVDDMLAVHQRACKKHAWGCRALGPHLFDCRDHERERTSCIPDAGDALVEKEARHRLGESRIVGQMDVEIPEARDEILSAAINDLGGAKRFTRTLNGGDAPVAHQHSQCLARAVHGINDGDVLDGQIGRQPACCARELGQRDCEGEELEADLRHGRRGVGIETLQPSSGLGAPRGAVTLTFVWIAVVQTPEYSQLVHRHVARSSLHKREHSA